MNILQRLLEDLTRERQITQKTQQIHEILETVVGSPRVAARIFHHHLHVREAQTNAIDGPSQIFALIKIGSIVGKVEERRGLAIGHRDQLLASGTFSHGARRLVEVIGHVRIGDGVGNHLVMRQTGDAAWAEAGAGGSFRFGAAGQCYQTGRLKRLQADGAIDESRWGAGW